MMSLFGVTVQGFVYDVGFVINDCGTSLRALQLTLDATSMVVCQPPNIDHWTTSDRASTSGRRMFVISRQIRVIITCVHTSCDVYHQAVRAQVTSGSR